jgi:sulfhydrogenase subunit beta (sulfur reductase)
VGFSEQETLVVDANAPGAIVSALDRAGFEVIGPTVESGSVVYGPISTGEDLPRGFTDTQEPGHYRLNPHADGSYFGYVVGPHSWKRYLHPPAVRLFAARREGKGFALEAQPREVPPRAFFGVRPCELAAIARQDRIFLGGAQPDPTYRTNREGAFLVAVQCGRAGGTCFCASMGTGPRAAAGFDLALTELCDGGRHEFVVEIGSPRGRDILAKVPHRLATEDDLNAAAAVTARAQAGMGRSLEAAGLDKVLLAGLESPRWEATAARCLSCANCTMVCPTCFCTTVEDTTDLTGDHAERWRRWDSCFTLDFSYIHGGAVRRTTASRYRQWLTHKFATWFEQFGESGCVGCGRCITWCPAGIDVTEEARAFRTGSAPKERT